MYYTEETIRDIQSLVESCVNLLDIDQLFNDGKLEFSDILITREYLNTKLIRQSNRRRQFFTLTFFLDKKIMLKYKNYKTEEQQKRPRKKKEPLMNRLPFMKRTKPMFETITIIDFENDERKRIDVSLDQDHMISGQKWYKRLKDRLDEKYKEGLENVKKEMEEEIAKEKANKKFDYNEDSIK
ncbi:MAG: hypothetical protein HeimC2_43950 [Candidatus Heimdallarchaeota archaeon LC_2]|nr:MAG: hypothetical protein HeimC2_43950 [Candidatus Heimdallarchaeota archaeon LC_2]